MVMDKEPKQGAPFNMAVATLMRLDSILTDIKNVAMQGLSKESKINLPEAQRIKLNLIRQFFIQAIPLLKEEDIETLKTKLKGMVPKGLDNKNRREKIGNSYSSFAEEKMNDFIMEVQLKLQSSGNYFMPPKGDVRYGWKES